MFAPEVAGAASSYTLSDLGAFQATAISNGGEVVGGNGHAFSYTSSAGLVDLNPKLNSSGNAGSWAYGVNDSGQIVGVTEAGSFAPFSYTPSGGKVDLSSALGASKTPLGVNDSGEIVGATGNGSNGDGFSYTPSGGFVDLGTLPGRTASQALAVNAGGEVVGFSYVAGNHQGRDQDHAFSFTPATGMVDLGTLPTDSASEALAVNRLGEVVGWSGQDHGNGHAFSYTPSGGMVNLGTLPGGGFAEATGVSDSGEVVGFSYTANGPPHAFFYTPARGMVDLGTFPGDYGTNGPPASFATAVNNSGQIVGYGNVPSDSNFHAFLWQPGPDAAITAASTSPRFTEGTNASQAVATFSDPDPADSASEYSAQINWGDGSSSAGTITGGNGSFSVSASHTYAEEGSYTIKTTITNSKQSSKSASVDSQAEVLDAPLSAAGVNSDSSRAFSGTVATFSDANPNGTAGEFTASIDWGDGSSSNGTITGGGGSFSVGADHAYASDGSYAITTRIRDADGSSDATSSSTVTVAHAAPQISCGESAASVTENQPTVITLPCTSKNGAQLTYSIIRNPEHGDLGALSGDTVTYTPHDTFVGSDSITFQALDASTGQTSDAATVHVTVVAQKTPVCADGSTTVAYNQTTTIALYCAGPDGDPVRISIVHPPEHGDLGILHGDVVTYTPHDTYTGPDSFTFQAEDTSTGNFSPVSTFYLTVAPAQQGPQGEPGPPGPVGPQGAPGPAGKNGQVELVTCKTTGKGKNAHTVCTTQLLSGTASFTATGKATLSRGHILYATGLARTVHGHRQILLHPRRRLTAGRYTLAITGKHHVKRTVTLRLAR